MGDDPGGRAMITENNIFSSTEIDGVTVDVTGGVMLIDEMEMRIKYFRKKYKNKKITRLDITIDGEFLDIVIYFEPVKFERIRRITGYLVGTLDRFNNAKRAEVTDRVKHDL